MTENNTMETTETVTETETASGSGPFSATSETVVYNVHLWDEHPMMSTSFSDYSVAEGLLLLIFVLLLLDFFLNLFRRWF